MKNFLKSTAIFACLALLMCACSEDSTEDTSVVDPSSIRSVTPGDGKFKVRWTVPSNDAITKCIISWTSDKGAADQSTVYATSGTNEQTITGLSAGTYTISVVNCNDTKVISTAVESTDIVVYDYTSFVMPKINSVLVESAEEMNVYVEWSDIDENCKSVFVTMTDASGATTKFNNLDISSGTSLLTGLTNKEYTCTYSAYFQPEGGLDETFMLGDDSADVPDLSDAPPAPENVVVNSLEYGFMVTWDLNVMDGKSDRSVIVYNDGEESVYYYVNKLSGTGNNVTVPVAEIGSTYSIAVRNVSNCVLSDSADGDSDATPYDMEAFKASADLPPTQGTWFNDTTYYMTINWLPTLDCEEMFVKYVDHEESISYFTIPRETLEAGGQIVYSQAALQAMFPADELTILGDVLPGASYSITMTYRPAGNAPDDAVFTKTINDRFDDAPVVKYLRANSRASKYYEIWEQDLYGDAHIQYTANGTDDPTNRYNFYEIFDDTYSYSTTSNSGAYAYISSSDSTSKYQTLSFDLGRTYKLSEMSYTPLQYYGFASNRGTLKKFSVYGSTSDPTAAGNEDMQAITEDSEIYVGSNFEHRIIPDLSSSKWTLLLDEVEVISAYTNAMNPYDYNGDGVIDINDDYDLIGDNAIRFSISDSAPAVRYIRIQFLENFKGGTDFMITEMDFWHRGVFAQTGEEAEFQARLDDEDRDMYYIP